MCDTRDGMGWGFEEVEGGRKGRTVVFDQGRVHGEGWFEGENLLAVRFGGEGGVRRGGEGGTVVVACHFQDWRVR